MSSRDDIPRPPNKFILFRCHQLQVLQASKNTHATPEEKKAKASLEENQAQLASYSRQISEAWRALPSDEKARWAKLAEIAKAEHKDKYPNYKFKPKRKEKRPQFQLEKRKKRCLENSKHIPSDKKEQVNIEELSSDTKEQKDLSSCSKEKRHVKTPLPAPYAVPLRIKDWRMDCPADVASSSSSSANAASSSIVILSNSPQ